MIHWFTDPFATDFMKRALAVAVCVGVLSPIVGTWIVLRRLAYLGDAMSHATLAGVAIAFAAGASVLLGARRGPRWPCSSWSCPPTGGSGKTR